MKTKPVLKTMKKDGMIDSIEGSRYSDQLLLLPPAVIGFGLISDGMVGALYFLRRLGQWRQFTNFLGEFYSVGDFYFAVMPKAPYHHLL